MTSRISSATLDDGAIGQLAAEPQRPLFPLLAQAEAMIPLVVVLAFLPPLYALNHRTLTEAGAREGLLSLRCLAAVNLADAVDPARHDPLNPLRFEPPLMNWLTALSLRLFGVGSVTGIIAPAYLCTAGLIFAGYVLARRLGGERLGLVTAGLLAFNPLILEGAQEPIPQSLACLLAVLALAGTVAHWQKSGDVTSYQLLLGGLALGMCLLAGGPIALAVVFVLLIYIAWWKFFAWFRTRLGVFQERSLFHRRPVVRSTAVLAATAFAVGGWHALFMSARYGHDFWNGWWTGGITRFLDAAPFAGPAWILEGAWELNRLALPVFGLSLVGV
ncbi:MAG: glycosyltransferase family 39 protein, partial [Deltaproteobacteria bacterium]